MNHGCRGPDTPADVRVESTLSCWMVLNDLARSKKTTTLVPFLHGDAGVRSGEDCLLGGAPWSKTKLLIRDDVVFKHVVEEL